MKIYWMQGSERVFMSATRDGKMWRCQFYYEDWQGIRGNVSKGVSLSLRFLKVLFSTEQMMW